MIELVDELRERATNAEQEGTATSRADARYFRAAADRIEALEAERAWRAIETAPRDGTPILCARFAPGTDKDGRVRVDWWRTAETDGYDGFGHFNAQWWPATHWMTLPGAPS